MNTEITPEVVLAKAEMLMKYEMEKAGGQAHQAEISPEEHEEQSALSREAAVTEEDVGKQADPAGQAGAAAEAGDDSDAIADSHDEKMPPEVYKQAMERGMVSVSKTGRLIYSKHFYQAMYKNMQDGMKSVDAFIALGFDIRPLGKERGANLAYQAAKHTKQKAAKGELFAANPGNYDGTIPSDQMEGLDSLPLEEQVAYFRAREIYQTKLLEAQKKTYSTLAGRSTSSKHRK